MSVELYPAVTTTVATGGKSVIAVYAGELGGVITNPLSHIDQGVGTAEFLYINPFGPASTSEGNGTFALYPGNSYEFPAGTTTPIWVNAVTGGHKFSAFFKGAPLQYPPNPVPATFPPPGPTTQTNVIPSYLYQEYSDDDDLQAFVDSYNGLAQQFIDTLNALNLPIYTGLSGSLLDWVARGLYGMSRPSLSSGLIQQLGPYNTAAYDVLSYNQSEQVSNVALTITSDDIFKRILTWHFYKGDGKTFNVRWLKRRIMRFINGVNGSAPNVDNTYQVSVSFGLDYQVNITLITKLVKLTGGGTYNASDYDVYAYNAATFSTTNIPPLNSFYLVEGIKTGVLELPFQFTYVITVG